MEVIASGFGLTEAPRWDAGVLWFTDVTGGGVHRLGADGAVETVVPKRRGVGGLALHADGGVVMSGRDLVHVAPDGSQRVLLEPAGAGGFNDIAADGDGSVLAGMLRYSPLAGETPVPGALVRVTTPGERETLADGIDWPNGVGVAPDGRTVYIADYASGRLLSVVDGGHSELARAPRGSADGLAVDAEGGIWVALGDGRGIARFAPDGELVELVEVPAEFVTSVCFGGDDGRDLYVTAFGSILRGRAPVPGLSLARAKI